jgi:hypothetical protein
MTQVCDRCYRIVHRACQSDTERQDCPKLNPHPAPATLSECRTEEDRARFWEAYANARGG